MARPRFLTAREVFDAFPSLADDMRAAPTGDTPIAFMKALATGETPEDALTFCAFALARREAVWWACQCVRSLGQIRPGEGDPCLKAAEDWVREPEEDKRQAALQLGSETDHRVPSAWLALAAAWSGGNTSRMEGGYVRASPEQTAKAARIAILIALAKVPAKDRAGRLGVCVDGGVKLIEQEMAAAG